MQRKPFLTNPGQEIQFDDFNRAADAAARADDVALAPVTRIPSNNSRLRAILPYAPHGNVDNSVGTVSTGTGGTVTINPFWVVLGPTPSSLTDIRNALYAGNSLSLAAQNAGAGTFRIDLIYATIYVDQNLGGETRWRKDPATKAMSQSTLPVQKQTYVTVSVQAGVASSTPTAPALPSDPPGGFNVALARVKLPNGFTSLSSTTNSMIMDISSLVHGGIAPASAMYTPGSAFCDGVTKSKHFLAAGSVGKEERVFGVDGTAGSFNGQVIDDSIDWRKRVLKVSAQFAGGGEEFPWHSATGTALPATGGTTISTLSNSFPVGGADKTIFSNAYNGGTASLVVDATTGALKLAITGSTSFAAFFWVDASAQIRNT